MFGALKFLFSHSAREMEVIKIVDMRMRTFDVVVNGNASDEDRRAYRLNAEYEAHREINQRMLIEVITLFTAGIGLETALLHVLG